MASRPAAPASARLPHFARALAAAGIVAIATPREGLGVCSRRRRSRCLLHRLLACVSEVQKGVMLCLVCYKYH